MAERKQHTVGTTVSERDYNWILKRIDEGKAINQADLLRMALRLYMDREREKEMERKLRLRQLENESQK